MTRKNKAKDPSIKEWAILRLKKGYIPKQIAADIQKLHGVSVTTMTIYRWRKDYIQDTGEHIPTWHELKHFAKKKEEQKKRTQK